MIGKLISWAFVVVILGECLVESQFVNLTQFPGEQCNSKCVKGQNRICYYEWTLELYHAMGPACGNCSQGVQSDCLKPQCIIGDGFQKGVMSINRMIPGPAVHVCEGDLVVIDVKNMAPGTAAAIHWHGLHMVETPYMDGLPFVTQCPISFETSFRYQFYATEPGTHFYHSHSGVHRLNGQYGVLIVRQPDEDNKSIDLYDYDLPEHFILISDWRHEYAENSFPGLPKGVSFPQSILINGRGTFIDRDTLKHNQVPVTIFYVTQGNRYRFNCINAYSLTDIVSVQVEKHSMTVIATDSFDVEPFETHTLTMNAGERYDFVFAATQPSGDYWIRIRGLNTLQPQPTESFALIRYITKNADYKKPQPPFPDYNKPYPTGYSLNSPSATCFYNDKEYCVADLVPLDKDTELVTRKPDYKFVFSFYNNVFPVEEGFIPGKYKRFDNPEGDVIANGVINNKSLIFPPQPILTQYPEVDKSLICDKINYPEKCKGESICECIHLIKIKKNTIVEMSLYDQVNEPSLEHPFHLHGHRFAVMGITNNTANLKEAIEFASIYRKRQPVWKDSVTVPTNGLVVTRFRADNPGIWLMHCHYENHLATGMALLFQVGEPNEWVQAPEAFPKCGNYLPGVREDNPNGNEVSNGIVNNISLIFPPQPILTQNSDVDKSLFCDRSDCPEKCNGESTRDCIHLIKIKTNSIVEMALYDKMNKPGMDHPFHLHGYGFALMGISNDTSNLTEAIEYASTYRKNRPVLKDTVSIPRNGVAVFRYNKMLHLATGMAVLIQVGEPDEWVQAPEDFPKCGNYIPAVKNHFY